MPANPGNSNVTKKGTKQRSFNLDDATFAIVEAEAARLHITNSAALSSILNDWDGLTLDNGSPVAAPMQAPGTLQPQRDLSHLLPSETATNFEVNDPGNDAKATGAPSVKRTRSKLDNKISDDSDVVETEPAR